MTALFSVAFGLGAQVRERPPLAESAFYPLPLTSVKPSGWLREQLRIQAEGITGHLDEFWPDVGPNSAWLGGPAKAGSADPTPATACFRWRICSTIRG